MLLTVIQTFWTRLADVMEPLPLTTEGEQTVQLLSQLGSFMPPDFASLSPEIVNDTALLLLVSHSAIPLIKLCLPLICRAT